MKIVAVIRDVYNNDSPFRWKKMWAKRSNISACKLGRNKKYSDWPSKTKTSSRMTGVLKVPNT